MRLPQPDCLSAAQARALAGTDGAVRLLTYAPSCGYEQNPISVYYCYPAAAPPGAPPHRALAEVTNTPWGERVRFAFALGEDVLPKPLHVSPFMEMSPAWRITAEAPGRELHLAFSVETPAHAGAVGSSRASSEPTRQLKGDDHVGQPVPTYSTVLLRVCPHVVSVSVPPTGVLAPSDNLYTRRAPE